MGDANEAGEHLTLECAFERIVALGAAPEHAETIAQMRRTFELRTGALDTLRAAEHPHHARRDGGWHWFEARTRAFWDDALTTQMFAHRVEGQLAANARAWVAPLARAHRGLFFALRGHRSRLQDAWSGAEYFVDEIDDATREALRASRGPFDGRVVARPGPRLVALLPGAIFHPEDAKEPIRNVLETAQRENMALHDVLDALLRMERNLRELSRVKAAYAYRVEALSIRPATTSQFARERAARSRPPAST